MGVLSGSGAGSYAQNLRFKRGINQCGNDIEKSLSAAGCVLLADSGQNTGKAVLDLSDHSARIILRKKTIGILCIFRINRFPLPQSRLLGMTTLPRAESLWQVVASKIGYFEKHFL